MWGALQFWAHLAMKARLLLNLALQLLRHRQCVLQVVAHASRLRLVYMQRVHWQDDAHLFCSAAVRGRQRLLGRGRRAKRAHAQKSGDGFCASLRIGVAFSATHRLQARIG